MKKRFGFVGRRRPARNRPTSVEKIQQFNREFTAGTYPFPAFHWHTFFCFPFQLGFNPTKNHMKRYWSGMLLFLGLVACTDSRIISSWKSSNLKKDYNHIMVIALTHDTNAKTIVENDLADALTRDNIRVSKSREVFSPDATQGPLKDEMISKIKGTGADAILTVSLLNRETHTHYVPGYPGYAPGFWGYYNFWYPTVYTPGYYTQDHVYYIEANLYDVATDDLIWTAESKTYNPASITGFSRDLAALLARKLVHEKVIVARKTK
jgi:hypothetical protein